MKGTEREMGMGLLNLAVAPIWRPALGIVDKDKSATERPSWAKVLLRKPEGRVGANNKSETIKYLALDKENTQKTPQVHDNEKW